MARNDAPKKDNLKADSPQRRDKIGRKLKDLYDSVTQESVPDDFLRLLEQADARIPKDEGEK